MPPMPFQAVVEPLLSIEHLSRRFGAHDVIHSLTLALREGERLALRGPNGSGKTTVLRCVSGTLTPSGGTIRIAGHPAGSSEARERIGVSLSQERSFYLRLSGRTNLLIFAGLRNLDRREAHRRVKAIEEELGLQQVFDERVDRCSTGMVQQLAIARALLAEPMLFVLDEPTRSLDQAAAERFWSALDRRPRPGLLLGTHRQDDVDRCGRCIDLPA